MSTWTSLIHLWVRRLYVPLAAVALAMIFGNYWALHQGFDPNVAGQNPRIRFQQGGENLGQAVSPREAALADAVVDTARPVLPGHVQLLYLGNSQTLAIMDYQPGDLTTPQWLQILLASNWGSAPPIDVRLGSLANMTPTEYLIRLVSAREADPKQVDMLLEMVVLEEFRDLSVRPEVAAQAQDPKVRQTVSDLVKENLDLPLAGEVLAQFLNSGSGNEAGQTTGGAEGGSGTWFDQAVEAVTQVLPVFKDRASLRGRLYVDFYHLRNKLLGIDSSSARAVTDYEFNASMQLLELGLRYADDNGVLVLLYLTPLRPIQPNPNLPQDVERVKGAVTQLCDRYGISCVDYTDLIPESLWTDYPDQAGSRDFAHFTGPAHKIVAEMLWQDLGGTIQADAKKIGR